MLTPSPANMTVSDYCAAMERHEVRINSEYQRSDKVWPPAARSYLIESIILGFPIPKIYHHSITNLRTGRTIREIIDGQQRSKAINDFYNNKFRLTGPNISDELKGRLYSELDDDAKGKFLTYLISIDLFTGAEPSEVRQLFRRMNSFTVPLNPEEMRHAIYQGVFKWFIADIAEQYQETLKSYGILTEKAITRMQDLKLLTECAHAMRHGVTTTNKTSLERIYRDLDDEFSEEQAYRDALEYALSKIQEFDTLPESNLTRPYVIYALILALVSHHRDIPNLENEYDEGEDIDLTVVGNNIVLLSDALDLDEDDIEDSPFAEFISACSERTNVKDQRETRIKWLMRALEQPLGE